MIAAYNKIPANHIIKWFAGFNFGRDSKNRTHDRWFLLEKPRSIITYSVQF